jgi:hypothetical protein
VKHTLELLALSGLVLCSTVACQGDVSLGRNDDLADPGSGDPSGGSSGTGSTGSNGGASGGGTGGAGNDPTTCNGGGETWSELLRGEWSLQPGEEAYFCIGKTLTEHGFIRASRGIHADFTYSAVLSVGPVAVADGTEPCPQQPPGQQVFTSSSGTNTAILPDGAALPVYAGQQVILRIDVINTSAQVLSGESVQQVQWVPSSEVRGTVSELNLGILADSFDAPVTPGNACDPWVTALSEGWTVQPGSEAYQCVRRTLTEDLTLREIQNTSPFSIHSLVVSAGVPVEPDGVTTCDWETVADQVLLGSIPGTHRITALEGRGLTLPAGSQLLLNLHLINTSVDPLSGTALVQVR